jgi:hypothetical protein
MEGVVLGDSEEHAKQLLRDEFGDVPEFEILELIPNPEPLIIEDEDDQLDLPFIVN